MTGRIGVCDYDEIEITNLHRQFLHTEEGVGQPKVESIKKFLKSLNSDIEVVTHRAVLNSSNAAEILSLYDIIVDATDNVATRYLINDCCVMLKKPLVSGSALAYEGQLTVYCYNDGPCYRCIFPKPPPPETVQNCGDGGVLGASNFSSNFLLKKLIDLKFLSSHKCHWIASSDGSAKDHP